MDRVRRTRQGLVGGPYGLSQHILEGAHPCPRVVFFDDGVPLFEAFPAVKQHGTWNANESVYRDSAGATDRQVILKLERPVLSITGFFLPGLTFDSGIAVKEVKVDTVFNTRKIKQQVRFSLIRANLSSGQFALEDLTWNLAAWPNGTLYGDPDNFITDTFLKGWHFAQVANAGTHNPTSGTGPFDPNNQIDTSDGGNTLRLSGASGVGYWFQASDEDKILGEVITGLHLFIDPGDESLLVEEGTLVNHVSHMGIDQPFNLSAGTRRPFVLGGGFTIVGT